MSLNDHSGFHRSRGLTNGLEYTYSSPSAYTADRGYRPATHDRVDNALPLHFVIFDILTVSFVSPRKLDRTQLQASFPQRNEFSETDAPKCEPTKNGDAGHKCVSVLLVLKRPNRGKRSIPCFRTKSSVYRNILSSILTGVTTGLTSTLPENIEFPNKQETLPYNRHILDFPTYPPPSDPVCEGS
ncbi:hypothetical protein ONZ45_g7690 [Pleurotus djamor]|nr:hypothetical protein ONZ45_g7690 [Pleurotus djamor]